MKWFSNLPDNQHVPFQFIAAEPHIKTVFSAFRASDYLTTAAFGAGFPGLLYLWEKRSPSLHPRNRGIVFGIQIPFFLALGGLYSAQRVLYRFWGWQENSREVEMFGDIQERKTSWSTVDW